LVPGAELAEFPEGGVRNERTNCSRAFVFCDLPHLDLRRSGPRCGGAKRRKTMTEKPSKQIPQWLTIDVLIIVIGLVIIAGGIWITNARISGVPV